MCDKEKAEPSAPPEPLTTDELPEQSGKEAQVRYRDAPAPPPPGQKIHERPHIPPIPEGEEVPDKTPSPPVKID
ncbi:MAG: hypothetical protein M3539_02545 [Acidobacteriota bacterium]|nr:hypothetical protein [Acidobacteriota bacterium]